MREIKSLVERDTKVVVLDEKGTGNANHQYQIVESGRENEDYVKNYISFQNGAIKENGVNGCQNEDLLEVVIDRLQGFQSGDFSCRENAIALTHIQEALMWLERRTLDRRQRGIEGKNIK